MNCLRYLRELKSSAHSDCDFEKNFTLVVEIGIAKLS